MSAADDMELEGRVVVVTGAARGLGRDYAKYFADDGADVVLADVLDTVDAAAEASASGSRCLSVHVDVTDRSSVEAMVEQVDAELGRLDVLVNNAGLWRGLAGSGLLHLDDEMWERALAVNMTGTLRCFQAVVPIMQRAGWGRVINVSSMASRTPSGAYGVTKMAVNQMTLAMAADVGDLGITVNCIAPGISAFDAAADRIPDTDVIVSRNIVKRLGASRELYGAMRYLCSHEAAWTTGQTLHVNGGAFAVF